jgi:hypothetical protein
MSESSQALNRSIYKCKCNTINNSTTKNANFFSGNTNKPEFLITDPYLLSTLVRTASFSNSGKTVFANRSLNAYGRWEGAPGGSGCPLKNTF